MGVFFIIYPLSNVQNKLTKHNYFSTETTDLQSPIIFLKTAFERIFTLFLKASVLP